MKFVSVLFFALLLTPAANAADLPDHLRGHSELETADGSALRSTRLADWAVPGTGRLSWNKFVARRGVGWRVYWDAATKVPGRIYGPGIPAAGSMASPTVAEAYSRQILAAHIDLLAPGASPSDFVMVSNDLSQGVRSVGFFQQHQGQRVIGGQVSFRFKNDRLFVIGSEALPFVNVPTARVFGAPKDAETTARAWIAADFSANISASLVENNGRSSILPLVDQHGGVRYRRVVVSHIDSRTPLGSWKVYTDAATGDPVARRQTLRFAAVQYNAPERRPGGTHIDYPAANAAATVNGSPTNVDGSGNLTLAGTSSVTVRARGTYARVINDAGAAATFNSPSLTANGTLTWNDSGNEVIDAQINAYIHSDRVMAWARLTAPGNSFYDGQLEVNVNLDQGGCNAFSDGVTINFLLGNTQCNNTGRLADVVFHEFGHTYHAQNLIPGVGQYDGALGEGIGDYLSATITGDAGMGRGFFRSNQPLRDIDLTPENIWPDDIGEIHETGIIIAGALWDLRKNMIVTLGQTAGVAYADQVHLAITGRAVDVPSSYIEALVYDDDDGDISNGTPNLCDINEAFGRHGLADPNGPGGSGVSNPTRADFAITLPAMTSTLCVGMGVASADLVWKVRGDAAPAQTVSMTSITDAYEGAIPAQGPGTVVQYQVSVTMDNGTTLTFPQNPADPFYEFFVGAVIPLYCTDFESDPMTEGWVHGLSAGTAGEGADDWVWNPPGGTSGSGDPAAAFSPTRVIGNDLGGGNFNGKYQADKVNFMDSPAIDTTGFDVIRLQYRRWLNVEDGGFDQGTIYANDLAAWSNLATGGSVHHSDAEWRFHDVDVTAMVQNNSVQIKYELASDGGLELGGWTIDDFCIVAFVETCGNGTVEAGEQCDDGNMDDTDECRNNCTLPPASLTCGDGVVDAGEDCDDGNGDNTDACLDTCRFNPNNSANGEGGCGCTVSGQSVPAGPLGLALFGLFGLTLLVARRKRRG